MRIHVGVLAESVPLDRCFSKQSGRMDKPLKTAGDSGIIKRNEERRGAIELAQQKKMVEEITSMDEDFAKWYTDIVKKAELIDYSSVRGCYVLRPYGYAIWENIQKILDARFKELGHENVSMPLLIPESLLQKEKDHVEASPPKWLG